MNYLKFKNDLRAIGEGEKAVEYNKVIKTAKAEMDKMLHDIQFECDNTTKRQYIEEYYLPEIDKKIDLIRKQPNKVRPILCRALLEFIRVEFEEDDLPGFSKAGMNFIKTELMEIEKHATQHPTTQPPTTNPEQGKGNKRINLSINQIALKSVFEGLHVTRDNAYEIVKPYNHNSGEKLFQKFTYYSKTSNRKGKPTPLTPKKFQNKIELFESVVELLKEPNKQRAIDELNILKNLYQSEFE